MKKDTEVSLFEAFETKNLKLKNRIAMAPMTRSRAIGSIPNDLMAEYYSQRSSAGLIITEGTSPSPNGLGYPRIPGIYTKEQVEGWKKITHAAHEKGAKIFIQFMHTGRIAHPANFAHEGKVLGPSAVQADSDMWTDESGMQSIPEPEAMTEDDLKKTIAEFSQAAKDAVTAGFDGVELHGASGYLLEQFLNPHVNVRTDQYGGSIENRIRFVLEVAESVANAIGAEKTGIRLSPFNTFNDMPAYEETPETYTKLVEGLNKLDLAYIHLVEGFARDHKKGPGLLNVLSEKFDNLVIVNGGYDRESAEKALKEGRADLVAFGAPFISNPDLPRRLQENIPLAEADKSTFYSADEKGYTDYAFSKN
ncbi:alkene reductase [Gracilimonas mengyeensis]|uniref:N-ethylmaleimide reductase n=1 Tax=Gracilimonas mengyeensis TaxID=1302730 RepID=A0A521FD12_9BACT|nr:alkene reductase [Gracilimonas mengyeensis]SMO94049.1 N-ethylmaleimide reductase [Gracilimonas mengyeensis]